MEAALSHVVRNKVEGAYARSDLFERRRQLMDDWARYLASESRDPAARIDPLIRRAGSHAGVLQNLLRKAGLPKLVGEFAEAHKFEFSVQRTRVRRTTYKAAQDLAMENVLSEGQQKDLLPGVDALHAADSPSC